MNKKIPTSLALIIIIVLAVLVVAGVYFYYPELPESTEVIKEKEEIGKEKVQRFGDAHAHLCDINFIDKLIQEMDKNGVEKIVLFGSCEQDYRNKSKYVNGIRKQYNKKILEAYKRYSDRVLPILSGFDPQNNNSVDYVEEELKKGIWKGIGELYMIHESLLDYKTRADNPVMREIYKLLAKYDIPIFFHYERRNEEDVQVLLKEMKANPDVKFIWVHFAHHRDIRELEKELTENLNMYVELEESAGFSPAQIALFEKFPDRFLLGTDIGCFLELLTTQKHSYLEAINMHKKLLDLLTPNTAKNLEYKNLFRLLKIPERIST